MRESVRRPRYRGESSLTKIPTFVKPSRRMLLPFAVVTVLGWAFLALTFVCWDGWDSAGRRVGACEPLGGNISWLVVPVAAYIVAVAFTALRPPSSRS